MAAVGNAEAIVLEIALQIPQTENVLVYEDLADVALALPPPRAAAVAERAATGLTLPYQALLPEKLGAIVTRLAKGGQTASALAIAERLLEIVPDDEQKSAKAAEEEEEEEEDL